MWKQSFPRLYEELRLSSNGVTPLVQQGAVLLGSLVPFRQAAAYLSTLLGVQLSTSCLRRLTEEAGRHLQHVQDQYAHPLASVPVPQPAPTRLAMATDGVFVPVCPNEWAEVKMVSIGEVGRKETREGQEVAHCDHLSYFARLADAETFADLASGETRRRGVDQAEEVAAIADGAEWIVGFVDGQREDAVRILDFAHAAQ